MKNMEQKDFMSIAEFSKASGLSDYACRRLVLEEKIPFFRVGVKAIIPYEAGMKALEDMAEMKTTVGQEVC